MTLERVRIENRSHGLRTEVSTGKVTMLREIQAKHHHSFPSYSEVNQIFNQNPHS